MRWFGLAVLLLGCAPAEALSVDEPAAERPSYLFDEAAFVGASGSWPAMSAFADRYAGYPEQARGAAVYDMVVECEVGFDGGCRPSMFEVFPRHLIIASRDGEGMKVFRSAGTRPPMLCRGQCYPPQFPDYSVEYGDPSAPGEVEWSSQGDRFRAYVSGYARAGWLPPHLWEAWVYAATLTREPSDVGRALGVHLAALRDGARASGHGPVDIDRLALGLTVASERGGAHDRVDCALVAELIVHAGRSLVMAGTLLELATDPMLDDLNRLRAGAVLWALLTIDPWLEGERRQRFQREEPLGEVDAGLLVLAAELDGDRGQWLAAAPVLVGVE